MSKAIAASTATVEGVEVITVAYWGHKVAAANTVAATASFIKAYWGHTMAADLSIVIVVTTTSYFDP